MVDIRLIKRMRGIERLLVVILTLGRHGKGGHVATVLAGETAGDTHESEWEET